MNNTEKRLEEFVEKGANIEHDRWARWQKYLHSLCTPHTINSLNTVTKQYEDLETGGLVISEARVRHWERQISLPYDELTETEKEYDRAETRNYLPLLEESIQKAEQELLKKILNIINVPEDEIVNVMEKAIRDNIIAELVSFQDKEIIN